MRNLSFERLCARELMAGDVGVGIGAAAGAAAGAAIGAIAEEVSTSGYSEGKVDEAEFKIEESDIKIEGDFTESKPQFKIEFPPEDLSGILEGIEVEYQSFDSQGRPIRLKVNSDGDNSTSNIDKYLRDQMDDSIRTATGSGSGDSPTEVFADGFKRLEFVYPVK